MYCQIMAIIKHVILTLGEQRLCVQLGDAGVACGHSVGLEMQSIPLGSQEQSQSEIASYCGDENQEQNNFINCQGSQKCTKVNSSFEKHLWICDGA